MIHFKREAGMRRERGGRRGRRGRRRRPYFNWEQNKNKVWCDRSSKKIKGWTAQLDFSVHRFSLFLLSLRQPLLDRDRGNFFFLSFFRSSSSHSSSSFPSFPFTLLFTPILSHSYSSTLTLTPLLPLPLFLSTNNNSIGRQSPTTNLHSHSLSHTMSATVSTVPCKYRTGRTLGQGTYAVVKGTPPPLLFAPSLLLLFTHRKRATLLQPTLTPN